MGKKKRKLTQSQINGISWIAIALVISIGVYFFSKNIDSNTTATDTIEAQNISILEKKEDSVYHSRYPKRPHHHKNIQGQRNSKDFSQDLFSNVSSTPTRKPLTVELNNADTTTLMLLHGIGPAFARRIMKYRERLGGFTHKEQLLEVYGFTPELLNHIAPYLTLDTGSIRHIPVNSVELKAFIKHPYVDYYFARDLINLRSRGATFTSPDDLRAIPSCTDSMLTKLLPYLDFSDSK